MIIVDTTPLVAVCDARDPLHAQALRDLDHLGRGPLAVAQPVLTEACFLLGSPGLRRRLDRVLSELEFVPLPIVDERQWWKDVIGWLAQYHEHDPDLADGWLVVAASRQKRARIWTCDSEFRTTWRRLDGGSIALVGS